MDITPKGYERKMDTLSADQLDKPIDQYVEKTEESVEETPAPVVEATAENIEESVESPTEEVEEERVPKSRFLTMHQRAKQAEEEKEALEARIAALEQAKPVPTQQEAAVELPDYWVELYGDSEASAKAYDAELKRISTIEEKAAERAYERLRSQSEEKERIEKELASRFDNEFKDLSDVEGRTLTEDEQTQILEIVEEYSPKDAQGKIIREYITPIAKAYEVWTLRKDAASAVRKQARSKVTSLTSAKTEGQPSGDNSSEFIPGRRGQWESKLPT